MQQLCLESGVLREKASTTYTSVKYETVKVQVTFPGVFIKTSLASVARSEIRIRVTYVCDTYVTRM